MTRSQFLALTGAFGTAAFLASCGADSRPSAETPTPLQTALEGRLTLTPDQIEALRQQIQANAEAQAVFEPVMARATAALEQAPNPVRHIRVSGGHPAEERVVANEAIKDSDTMYKLALTGVITGEASYIDTAKKYVLAWANTHVSEGNPIDDTKLDRMWTSYDLLKTSFEDDEREQVMRWADQVAQAHLTTELTIGNTRVNNWQNHRLKLIGMAGYMTGNPDYINAALQGYQEQAAGFYNEDGTTYDFTERDALAYQTYGLEPMLDLARVAALNGHDIYSYANARGGSLQNSVNFLLPYVHGEEIHVEFEDTTVQSDRNRSDFGAEWQPKNATRVLESASFFDPAVLDELAIATESPNPTYPTFHALLYSVQR